MSSSVNATSSAATAPLGTAGGSDATHPPGTIASADANTPSDAIAREPSPGASDLLPESEKAVRDSSTWLSVVVAVGSVGVVLTLGVGQVDRPTLLAWEVLTCFIAHWWSASVLSVSPAATSMVAGYTEPAGRPMALGVAMGLLLGAPSMLFGSVMTDAQLTSLSTLMILFIVMVSACTVTSGVGHLLFSGACLVQLAAAWLARPLPVDRGVHSLVMLAAWGVCVYVHHMNRRVWRRWEETRRQAALGEAAMRRRCDSLVLANEAKGRLLNTASHEVRQPVHALGMLLERLRMDPQSKPVRAQVDELASVVQSLSRSLNVLLDISRLESGNVRAYRTSFPIQELVDSAISEYSLAAQKKGLTLLCGQREPLQCVNTDKTLLYCVLSNLLSNAVRYTQRGGITVSVRMEAGLIWVDVKDTGQGIPAEMKEEIFKEYVRLGPTSHSTPGFGLGLSIVQRTADMLGLEVRLESMLGQGSTFSISVPCSPSLVQAGPVVNRVPPAAASVGRGLVGLRGVLVDNDAVVLRGMEEMVRSWGCKPIVAHSHVELESKLAHVADRHFDFVIVDYHLGDGLPDGLDVIRLVRTFADREISARVLTGDLNLRIAEVEGAVVQVLHKPVSPGKLRMAIELMAAECVPAARRRSHEESMLVDLDDHNALDQTS